MQIASGPNGAAPPTQRNRWDQALPFLLICVQLSLVLLVVYLFEIEKQHHFFALLALSAVGFLVHAVLPAVLRPGFFTGLSLAGILFMLGWEDGAWVIGIGSILIVLASLPISLRYRAGLSAIACLVLVMARMEFDRPFWAVLGAMFMFRLIVYLHDTRHARERMPNLHTLSYFFQLPNVCFTLYPVVDYKTYLKSYRTGDMFPVYQTGVAWIVRGLAHLLAYRAIRYYLLPAPSQLTDLPHLALFLATNYALYLRVSGQFHIITGILHLFGYEMPRTHHNYFLASSFTDIWRRINIYWKDFMSKVFFFPALFAFRRLGERAAFVVATLCVFFATWLLHGYQVFWLLGTLPFSLQEGGLWMAAGVFVAINLQFELSRSDRPANLKPRQTLASTLLLSLRVVGMFVLISAFWACWNTPHIWTHVREIPLVGREAFRGVATVAGVLLLAIAAGMIFQFGQANLARLKLLRLAISPTATALALTVALATVVVAGTSPLAGILGSESAGVIASLRRESATPAEAAQAVQGYYEEITTAQVQPGSWLALMEGRPVAVHYNFYTAMTRMSDPWLERELIPGWSGKLEDTEGRVTINRLGIRDRPDLTQAKPPHTCRLAMVGSSVVLGYGVDDSETFPHLLENLLNTGRPPGDVRCQVLNFGTGMSHLIHRHVLVDRKVFGFEPDALYYFAHQDEFQGPYKHLARLALKGGALPYPCLTEIVQRAGIEPGMTQIQAQIKLEPFAKEIVVGVYRHLVDECRKKGVMPVWMYLPIPGITAVPADAAPFLDAAGHAGFTVVDLEGWSKGHPAAEIKQGETDEHPNAPGQRLIAESVYAVMRERPEIMPACARSKK